MAGPENAGREPTLRWAIDRLPRPAVVARIGLGLTLVLAGWHKLVSPATWSAYVTTWLEPFLIVSPVTFMLVNGVVEIAVGIGLVADRYASVLAAVTALSLGATVGYLGVVAAFEAGRFADIAIRDAGLLALAVSVTLDALRRDDDLAR